MGCSRSNSEIYGRLSVKLSVVPLIRARVSREICDLSKRRIKKGEPEKGRDWMEAREYGASRVYDRSQRSVPARKCFR